MTPALSKADLTGCRKALAELQECDQCLAKAAEAGIDVAELQARNDYEKARLQGLYQTYGSTFPAPKGP